MPKMYMPVTDDNWEGALAPPMPSRAAVARWGGLSPNSGNWEKAGRKKGFRIAEVEMD